MAEKRPAIMGHMEGIERSLFDLEVWFNTIQHALNKQAIGAFEDVFHSYRKDLKPAIEAILNNVELYPEVMAHIEMEE